MEWPQTVHVKEEERKTNKGNKYHAKDINAMINNVKERKYKIL